MFAMINNPKDWPCFATESEVIQTLQLCFLEFKISHISKEKNGVADSLGRSAHLFYREFYYIGCSIPVWLRRPPQV